MVKVIKTQYTADGSRATSMVEYESEQRARVEMMREIVYGYDAGFREVSVQLLGEKGEYIGNEVFVYEPKETT